MLRQTPASRGDEPSDRHGAAERLIAPALASRQRALTEAGSMALLEAYGIPAVATRLAADLQAGRRAPHARSATRWR